MQEIRFNQPAPILSEVNSSEKTGNKNKSQSLISSWFWLVIKILLVLAILYGGLIGSKYFLKPNDRIDDYAAVFLANGQVYFGKFAKKDRGEIIMKEVYYLHNTGSDLSSSSAIDGGLQKTGFTLVKLGQELHGPEDLMYINQTQVLFYEYLRSDSQLVQTIQNYKK
jgi:hypothetical protein